MDCQAIFNEATAAADAAIVAYTEKYPAGSCGFAWVIIRPARGKFIAWCKTQIEDAVAKAGSDSHARQLARQQAELKYGDLGYTGGWSIWSPGFYSGQSMSAKEAGACAFAGVLYKHGIRAEMGSRID